MDKLFSEFPSVSLQEWINQIKKDLKTDDISKIMRKTIDGLQFEPFYRKENTENIPFLKAVPGKFPFVRGYKNSNSWKIRHNFLVENIENTRSLISASFDRELDIFGLNFGKKYELNLDELIKLTLGLNNVAFCAFENIEDAYFLVTKEKIKFESAFFNFDPLTYYAFVGKYYKDLDKTYENLALLLSNEYKNIKPIGITLHNYANAGATQVQQLAVGLSIVSQYFDYATERKIPLEKVIENVWFSVGISSEFFMEIAKIRAFRYLYAKLVEAFNKNLREKAITHIHGVTIKRNKTIFDPYVNMLRTSVEAFAGVVANVDSLSVLPFNAIYQNADEFSNRIAINQQIIIKNEAYADKYVDPAGGSYYVENLTQKLIEEAWNLFLKIEENGGFTKSVENNFISTMINQVAEKEINAIETGRISILGTNKYPNQTENLSAIKFQKPLDISDLAISNPSFVTLKIERLASKFEQMRLKTEKVEKAPGVFILTYGNAAMRRARADFAINFFAVAGFKIIDNLGFETIEQGIEAAKKANADIVVLCSSDDSYVEMAQKTFETLKNITIVVAGNPESRAEIEAIGIKNFIYVKSNLYSELTNYQKMLNI